MDVVARLYEAFAQRDGETMASLYAPDARFRDPVFGELTGVEAGEMWKMLTDRAEDLEIDLVDHTETSAHWIARYTFTQTGRKVVNDVHATFVVADDLIRDHVDDFSFWAWSRQALGPTGLALGWTPLIRAKVSRTARAGLDRHMGR